MSNITEIKGKQYTLTPQADGGLLLTPVENEKGSPWAPQPGARYYVADSLGLIGPLRYEDDDFDRKKRALGLMYPSATLANKAITLMKRNNLILRACLQVDPYFVPDWGKGSQYNYYPRMEYTTIGGTWGWSTTRFLQEQPAYVSTKEKAGEVCRLLTSWGVK